MASLREPNGRLTDVGVAKKLDVHNGACDRNQPSDTMWQVTADCGFLPSMAPLLSWRELLPGVEGREARSQPGRSIDQVGLASPQTSEDGGMQPPQYVETLLALEDLVSSMPALLSDTGKADALARRVHVLPVLRPQQLLVEVDRAGATPGHALAGLASVPRPVLVYALFRDYSLLGSAYVHEPRGKALRQLAPWEDGEDNSAQPQQSDAVKARADLLSSSTHPRDSLPSCLAVPLVELSRLTGLPPILEYTSYCLGAHTRADMDPRPVGALPGLPPKLRGTDGRVVGGCPSHGHKQDGVAKPGQAMVYSPESWRWHDLRLSRCLDGGTNEGAFILLHCEIEAHTPALVQGMRTVIEDGLGIGMGVGGATTKGSPPTGQVHGPDPSRVKAGLASIQDTMRSMMVSQLKMFNACDPHAYEARTRPWIFGWKGNEDLPRGVLYQGVHGQDLEACGWARAVVEHAPDGVRLSLRGETGAQSSIIPSLDILLGVTHRGDALKAMLVELEDYRPQGHRTWLRALRRAMWGDEGVPAGGAPGGHTGSRGYTAALCSSADPHDQLSCQANVEDTEAEAPHALRDYIRSTGDRDLVRAFNAVVQAVWAFRAIHVAYSDLYIARVTSREGATGGTPYKAYLRKHRDETRMHQLWDGPGGADDCLLSLPHTPSTPAQFAAEVEACLGPGAVNAIPAHLLARHRQDMDRYGAGDPSLERRCW